MKMQCIDGAQLSRRFIRISPHGSGKHRSSVELRTGGILWISSALWDGGGMNRADTSIVPKHGVQPPRGPPQAGR